jgi:hypothetical protein
MVAMIKNELGAIKVIKPKYKPHPLPEISEEEWKRGAAALEQLAGILKDAQKREKRRLPK